MSLKGRLSNRMMREVGGSLCVALLFAGCSTLDDEPDPSIQDIGVVRTALNISIPTSYNGPVTKMTDAITQAQTTPVFRGINEITLIPFDVAFNNKGTDTPFDDDRIKKTSTRIGVNVDLRSNNSNSPLTSVNNSITTLNNNGNNSQLYVDVELHTGTRSFLFYGKATDENATATATAKQINGVLNAAGLSADTPGDIQFSLESIYVSADDMADNLADFLTQIGTATYDAGGVATSCWEGLTELYTKFKQIQTGSSANVQAAVQDLYETLVSLANVGTAAEQLSAGKLKAAIDGLENADGTKYISSVSSENVLTFNTTLLGDVTDAKQCYPSNIGLPDGAAVVKWYDADQEFKVETGDNSGANVNNYAKIADYVYPPSLYYRANSDILTSPVSKKTAYEEKTTWPLVLKEYSSTFAAGVVESSTSSIAIRDQIEYAVGRFDVQVKALTTSLEDSKGKSVVLNATSIPVTGILIGGQKTVDFEFKPTIAGADDQTIYDNQAPEGMYLLNATPDKTFRTLVLETKEQSEDVITPPSGDPSDEPVRFAIEFRNNTGSDFTGLDGIVPDGCKFYLIGELRVSTVKGDDRRKYVYNRIKDDGTYELVTTTTPITQVFLQDYVTELLASVKSLKKAYNVIPDLRTPKLELGLSIDMNWQSGNKFTHVIE